MQHNRAVIFLTASPDPDRKKPLMLEDVLFCPILTWVARKLTADGVERFFAVCGPEYADEVRACLPEGAVVSDRHEELLDFVSGEGRVTVIPRAAVPAERAGDGGGLEAGRVHLRAGRGWRAGLDRPELSGGHPERGAAPAGRDRPQAHGPGRALPRSRRRVYRPPGGDRPGDVRPARDHPAGQYPHRRELHPRPQRHGAGLRRGRRDGDQRLPDQRVHCGQPDPCGAVCLYPAQLPHRG